MHFTNQTFSDTSCEEVITAVQEFEEATKNLSISTELLAALIAAKIINKKTNVVQDAKDALQNLTSLIDDIEPTAVLLVNNIMR